MELNEKTYETYFLLYIDNELSPSEMKAVESFVQSNPKYAASLQDLQKAVLVPASIIFEDKALLYRLEELDATLDMDFKKTLYRSEAAPIRSLWNRNTLRYSSIAALFILTIGTAVKYANNKGEAGILSANNTIAKNIASATIFPNASTLNAIKTNQTSQVPVVNTATSVPKNINSNSQIVREANLTVFENISNGVENTSLASNSKEALSNNSTATAEGTEALASIEKEQMNSVAANLPLIQTTSQTESFEEINTNESDRVIYISSIEIDSDKIRGFTRRINALFKRNKSDKQ
jgi:hypothetical protein